ncbi:uncharacterized protein LOC131208408 isoform X2 [Anopheles bellator]|uniref:uncharacterized protein LOC131208408 isoform X2 n=1 Tax=Anopheles bellator TaxID=139047 RepID=UPI00264A4A0A|nr:uncharacterized protein LOC131208408 isoform X2 [Anopheles bellator]
MECMDISIENDLSGNGSAMNVDEIMSVSLLPDNNYFNRIDDSIGEVSNEGNVSRREVTRVLNASYHNNTECFDGKENRINDNCNETLLEFPSATKEQSLEKFPSSSFEATHNNTSNAPFSEEELFTPADNYIFSSADFDCLLSRGSTPATAALASTTPHTSLELPRNSVLTIFDPLLRRQISVPAENSFTDSVETSSASIALPEFAQKQQGHTPFVDVLPTSLNTNVEKIIDQHNEHCFQDTTPQVPSCLKKQKCANDLEKTEFQIDETNFEKLSKKCAINKSVNEPEDILVNLDFKHMNDTVSIRNTSAQHPPISDTLQQRGGDELENILQAPSFSDSNEKTVLDNSHALEQINSDVVANILGQGVVGVREEQEDKLRRPTTSNALLKESCLETSKISQSELPKPHQRSDTTSVALPNSLEPCESRGERNHIDDQQTLSRESAENQLKYFETVSSFIDFPNGSNDLICTSHTFAEPIQEIRNNKTDTMSDDQMVQNENDAGDIEKNPKTDNHVAEMEKKMHDVELREESMLKRITEKDKTICKMSNVVEAYERTIAELISEKETLIRTHELECESLKQDNDINTQHMESLEKTFSNLYAKYERMKKNAIEYKEREEKLLNKVMKLEECLRAQEQRYEKMKSHAMSQLEIANTKIDEANRNHSQESAKLKALIKKEELYRISINEQLIQKSKENEELVKICDELISDTN